MPNASTICVLHSSSEHHFVHWSYCNLFDTYTMSYSLKYTLGLLSSRVPNSAAVTGANFVKALTDSWASGGSSVNRVQLTKAKAKV